MTQSSETRGAPAATGGPYTGVRVLDFSMFLAGPYCTRLMADMGATVVKVEPPGGDFLRAAPPTRDGHSAYFAHLNCGKQSLCLDLKQPGAAAAIKRLVGGFDVLLENFRPGVMRRLGLGYADIAAVKSDIVYCSVTGYGQTGPNANRPSFAPIIHAASGFDLLALRYEPALERPLRNRNAMADYLAATHALAGIGAALFHRSQTGQGQHIDVALMDTMHHAMSYEYTDAQFPGQVPPTFKPLRTADGFIVVAPVSEGNFRALAETAGHRDWTTDPRFATRGARLVNWDLLFEIIEEWTSSRDTGDLERDLLAAGCPCSAYRTIGESQRDPHVFARNAAAAVTDAAGSIQVANCPVHFSAAPASAQPWVSTLGQHGEEILQTAGFSREEVAALLAETSAVS